MDKLQEYCEGEYDYEESLGDFRRWLYLLVESWSCEQIIELYDKAYIHLCWDILDLDSMETCNYEVTIPQSIVAMAFDI